MHGRPENWYAWRFLMPTLARNFTVIAVDQRGIGLTEKARGGYDSATLASDLRRADGRARPPAVRPGRPRHRIHHRLRAGRRSPDRVARVALAEIPGPPIPPPDVLLPPLFVPEPDNNRLWHIPFNRVNDELIVDMVSSNADGFYRYEFAVQGGGATLPEYAIEYYVNLYNRNKNVLRASFGLYRAWDATLAQNNEREEPAADDACPSDRRGGQLGCSGRECRRERRTNCGHSRRRPLGCRAGS